MPKIVLFWFSAVHLSSTIPRNLQCAAAAEDDGGDCPQLTEGGKGTKCCSPAVATHIAGTSVEKAPNLMQGVGRETKRKGQVSLPFTMSRNSSRTSESPKATHCLPEASRELCPSDICTNINIKGS